MSDIPSVTEVLQEQFFLFFEPSFFSISPPRKLKENVSCSHPPLGFFTVFFKNFAEAPFPVPALTFSCFPPTGKKDVKIS